MYEFEISKVKSIEINFVSNETIETTSSYFQEWFQLPCQGGQREQCGWWSAKSYCKALNSDSSYWQDVLIEKKTARHQETWWWNDDGDNNSGVSEKCKVLEE